MQIKIYDTSGALVTELDLEFGPNVWRAITTASGWPGPAKGRFVPYLAEPGTIRIGADVAGNRQLTGPILQVSNVKLWESPSVFAGSGTYLDAKGRKTENRVMWSNSGAAQLSPVRRWILGFIKKIAPEGKIASGSGRNKDGTYSANSTWATMTNGWTHEMVVEKFKSDPSFTSCNSVAGGIVQNMIRENRLPERKRLKTGLLQLNLTDEDVAGSWVPAKRGWYPRPGDLYSRHSKTRNQKFGHTGIVISVENRILKTFDGGQDWRPHMGVAKVMEEPYDAAKVNGWADIDIWSYGRPVYRFT
jgi:hypothetical protein